MPLLYNATDSRFLTVAQSRTNNGQKDIRIILDIPTNDFYSLDDDGNFNPIASSIPNLTQVLSAGNKTGAISIISEDTFSEFGVLDGQSYIAVGNSTNLQSYVNLLTNEIQYAVTDLNTNDSTSIMQGVSSFIIQNSFPLSGQVTTINLQQNSVSIGFDNATTSHDLKVDVNGYFLKNLDSYQDDTAAGIGGVPQGYLYQTDGTGAAPLDVAGIVMIKQ